MGIYWSRWEYVKHWNTNAGWEKLQNTVKELKMDIAQLSSSRRISNFARNELKMIPADPETLSIYINQFD